MGGLLVALKEVVPRVGESAMIDGLQLIAVVADDRRVRELVVKGAIASTKWTWQFTSS